MAIMGGFYFKGIGVIQDYSRAHMWLNISISKVNEDFLELENSMELVKSLMNQRDEIAEKMTPTQIEKAQGMARECVAKNYKGC